MSISSAPASIGERVTVAGAFPAVARDLVGPSDTAGRQHDGLRLEDAETTALAVVAKRPDHAVAVLQQRNDGEFHVDVDAAVDAVVLERADHLEAGAIADVCQARIAVAAEVALEDPAVLRPVEDARPRPRARGRGPAPPSRAARPSASC